MKRLLEILTLAICLACILTLALIFASIWLCGDAWVGEENILIRCIESIIIVFGMISCTILIIKRMNDDGDNHKTGFTSWHGFSFGNFPSMTSRVRIPSPAPYDQMNKPRSHTLSKPVFNQRLLDGMLLSSTIEHYINGLYAENKSPNTIDVYHRRLKMFSDYIGDRNLSQIQPLHLREYLGHRSQGKAPATVHQSYRVLRTFFKWCLAEGIMEHYPLQNIKPPKLDYKIIETFTAEDIKKMMDACSPQRFTGVRNKAIILVLLDSGIRSAEMINLSVNDIDYRLGIIKVKGKGGKERLVRIGSNARQQLWRYMLLRDSRNQRGEERLFLSEEMKPFTKNGLDTIINKIGRVAGIEGKRCSPHTFRHTFSVSFLRAGGNVFDLQQLLGHTSLEMVKRYSLSLSTDDALKATG